MPQSEDHQSPSRHACEPDTRLRTYTTPQPRPCSSGVVEAYGAKPGSCRTAPSEPLRVRGIDTGTLALKPCATQWVDSDGNTLLGRRRVQSKSESLRGP
eukprot:CAMPEP_0202810222 /NCGR_PEP_ID=MMETSP1389-20130828/2395_1 /ASSEMBLY_ACC=CAM_ASM_000865 /TAXON_ID=302021 /ORGANISM="Rhodomonas sp., Strain CCMP768" /LENGTH=98 /DNA_ID=CAMNT_0049481061 /DNA_START=395 /DNA_END=687 /DNA_ORIENTATION=+